MTAEIAVINRLAVVLAADSAVTIGSEHQTKIFRSENKLFEVSTSMPVGLMVYNSLEFFGFPFEILAKDFRQTSTRDGMASISDWRSSFITFLENSFKPSDDEEIEFFLHQISRPLSNILSKVQGDAFREFVQSLNLPPESRLSRIEILDKNFEDVVDRAIRHYEVEDSCGVFSGGKVIESFLAKHRSILVDFLKGKAGDIVLSDAKLDKLFRWLFLAIEKKRPTELCSGLVFAGFGLEDKFPSLVHTIVDGCFGGAIKWYELDSYDVDRRSARGTVIAFAQPDVAHRFLYGVDAELEAAISSFFVNSFMSLPDYLKATVRGIGTKLSGEIEASMQSYVGAVEKHFEKKAGAEIKSEFFRSVEEMVQLMPKQEMAELAEALVNITTLKRRVFQEQETVGGPIDVAVISRHEGFVWVKRKHYFDAALNPRYFARANRQGSPREGGSDDQS